MVDLLGPQDDERNGLENDERLHEGCEKRISELRDLLEHMRSEYEVRLSESLCRMCRANDLTSGITLDQYYSDKIRELGDKHCCSSLSKELELKVYQIKEEVRKDYECEIDKIREEIVAKELMRKDAEINMIKAQLNEAHKTETEKMWRRYEELANKEVENSVIRVKNEVILSQELEDKVKIIEQLKSDKKELLKKHNCLTEQKQKEIEQLHNAHKKEIENLKQAFEIELTTRTEIGLEKQSELEKRLMKQIEKLEEDLKRSNLEKSDWQDYQKQELTEAIRKDILRALELQIKAMVASGDEGEDKSQWPPELVALERQFTSKYQHQLAQLVEEHALEIAEIRAEYDAKLSDLVKEYSIKHAEESPLTMLLPTGDKEVDKLLQERDNLRGLAKTLGQVVRELAQYLSTCEDELNRSLVGQLLELASVHNGHKDEANRESSDSEGGNEGAGDAGAPATQRKVHFAPDVSSIVSLMEEDCLEVSADVSVYLRCELEACLKRLRSEAAAVLGLTQGKERAVASTVEDRRLLSMTRQVIEEKKAKEDANSQLQKLQLVLENYEQELNEVHKELAETKERMIKDKVAVETEFAERQAEEKAHQLCHLQERARALLSEKGECPQPWLSLIEELCAEGDAIIDDACRVRDELQLEVEAADKQLRCTRAFLEEQAVEREQERDEFTKEVSRLTELLRERDKDWTSHKNFANEIDTLEQQVKDTTELLRDSEENKEKVEKELKAAVDKIWVLRDIVSELEVQVSNHCERELNLERRLAEVEVELETQTRGQADILQELQTLRGRGEDESLHQELHTLQDQLRKQTSPVVVRQIKSQLKAMARSIEKQIRELEAVNIHVSSASLSSPSEDVSIREQLEALRCSTPEERAVCNGSPPSPLPVEEIGQLSDKLLRYSRAAENLIKKLRDRDMEIELLRSQNEELLAERDVLQGQSERQLLQIASLRNRVEELRVRNERDAQANIAPLHQRILDLEKHSSSLTDQLNESQRKLSKMKQKLDRSEALVLSQEAEISSLSDHQHELVNKLREDISTMRTEKQQLQALVEKYRTEDNISFPQLVEVMLAEKNADIDHLQQRVEELQTQQEQLVSKSHQSKCRGYRVSFADDVASSRLTVGERARDAHHSHDSTNTKPFFSTPLSSIEDGGKKLMHRVIAEEISKISEPNDSSGSPTNRVAQLEGVLSNLKSDLEQKSQRLLECEVQLKELPTLEQELTRAKEELVATVKAVSEDKRFYEEQLRTLRQTQDLVAQREVELKKVQGELAQREEDIVRTNADVKALQHIMDGLQQKLQEAKTFAESCDGDQVKQECDQYKSTIASLEQQLLDEKAAKEQLQETIEKLDKDKQNIVSELVMSKSKCKTLQEELEVALIKTKESQNKIESLELDLEESLKENKTISANCQRLKKEMERLTKKQKAELKNILKKDSDEALKLKEELETLKNSNAELHSECDTLKQELNEVGNNLDLLKELNNKDDKINQLKGDLKRIDEDNRILRDEKAHTEYALNMEISDLKGLIEELQKNIKPLEIESTECQDKGQSDVLRRKYEMLKREFDRQRRGRRESEKKCSVLKDELIKEKQFSSQLQSRTTDRRVPHLVVTKANLIDITSSGVRLTNSLDDLTDEVQKELNASAQLDQSLISGLQQTSDKEEAEGAVRSEAMPQRVDYLRERLAEVEMALHVEQVVVSELRARLTEERARYLQERARVHELTQEVSSLHTLNDQFQDKFKNIALQLEQQVNEVKELRQNIEPADAVLSEKQKLKQLVEENQNRVDELLKEREFNKNQLLYLREEVAKLWSEKQTGTSENRSHGHGDNVEEVLGQEQRRSAHLQSLLDQANRQLSDTAAQVGHLNLQLNEEVSRRKLVESKLQTIELAERSRYSRRKVAEEKLKDMVVQAEKAKKEMERECLSLRLKLKQSHLQLTAHTAESPLSLRLTEANMAVERLVGEKEDLYSANILLEEENNQLKRRMREQDGVIDSLRSHIDALNIKVIDGGLDNLNAQFAAERAAWLKEKESLKTALAQVRMMSTNSDSFNSYSNSVNILQRYLRAESHRKALVWQKRYLMVSLRGYQEQEKQTVAVLSTLTITPPAPPPKATAEHRFRVVVQTVRAVSRMQFLVEHRRQAHVNTCRLLQHALSAKSFPLTAGNVPELQTLWRRAEGTASSSTVPPGSLSQYLDRFNCLQDRIKNTLSTAS